MSISGDSDCGFVYSSDDDYGIREDIEEEQKEKVASGVDKNYNSNIININGHGSTGKPQKLTKSIKKSLKRKYESLSTATTEMSAYAYEPLAKRIDFDTDPLGLQTLTPSQVPGTKCCRSSHNFGKQYTSSGFLGTEGTTGVQPMSPRPCSSYNFSSDPSLRYPWYGTGTVHSPDDGADTSDFVINPKTKFQKPLSPFSEFANYNFSKNFPSNVSYTCSKANSIDQIKNFTQHKSKTCQAETIENASRKCEELDYDFSFGADKINEELGEKMSAEISHGITETENQSKNVDLEVHEILNLLQPAPLPRLARTYSRQSITYSSSEFEEDENNYGDDVAFWDPLFDGNNAEYEGGDGDFDGPDPDLVDGGELSDNESYSDEEEEENFGQYAGDNNFEYDSSYTSSDCDSDGSFLSVDYKSDEDGNIMRRICTMSNFFKNQKMSYDRHVPSSELPSSFYSRDVKQGFQSLYQEELFTDITLISDEGKKFKCHKLVLSSLSGYFRALFTIGMKESNQNEIVLSESNHVVDLLLKYMYSGVANFSETDAVDLIVPAVYYQITSLREECEAMLCGIINAKVVIRIWRMAYNMFQECVGLKKACEKYLVKKFREFASSDKFVELTVSELTFILSKRIYAPREEQICEAVVRWFQNDLENREKYLHRVFKYVRLPLLGYRYWKQLKKRFPSIQNENLEEFFEEAETYHGKLSDQVDLFNTPGIHFRDCTPLKKIFAVFSASNMHNKTSRKLKAFVYKKKYWTSLCKIPEGVQPGFATSNYGNSCVLLTGGDFANDAWMYDGLENKWSPCEGLPTNRSYHCSVPVGNSVYLLGGKTIDHDTGNLSFASTIIKICPKVMSSWCDCGELIEPVVSAAASALNKNIYVFGGFSLNSSCALNPVSTVQCFDTTTGTTTVVSELPYTSSYLKAVNLDDAIFVVGGGKIQMFHPSNENDENGTYDIMCDSIPDREGFALLRSGDHFMIIGGTRRQQGPLVQSIQREEGDVYRFNTRNYKIKAFNFNIPNPVNRGGHLWAHNLIVPSYDDSYI